MEKYLITVAPYQNINKNSFRLAYAHENGIVLVDIIQKCVIINATLNDLYGGVSSSFMTTNNRDISIQPYATSSILQHHYQQTAGGAPTSSLSASSNSNLANTNSSGVGSSINNPSSIGEFHKALKNNPSNLDNGGLTSASFVQSKQTSQYESDHGFDNRANGGDTAPSSLLQKHSSDRDPSASQVSSFFNHKCALRAHPLPPSIPAIYPAAHASSQHPAATATLATQRNVLSTNHTIPSRRKNTNDGFKIQPAAKKENDRRGKES